MVANYTGTDIIIMGVIIVALVAIVYGVAKLVNKADGGEE